LAYCREHQCGYVSEIGCQYCFTRNLDGINTGLWQYGLPGRRKARALEDAGLPPEAAQLGARFAGLGTFAAGMPLDDAVRAVCEGMLGGPLEPPPPTWDEGEAIRRAWGEP
jgi:hypothetical protein